MMSLNNIVIWNETGQELIIICTVKLVQETIIIPSCTGFHIQNMVKLVFEFIYTEKEAQY